MAPKREREINGMSKMNVKIQIKDIKEEQLNITAKTQLLMIERRRITT
jgi:hypothetical protein